jgi:hypothetical protein
MSGGIFMCGISTGDDTTLNFVRLNNQGAQFTLYNIDLRYVSKMNSVVYITGGTVYFERVKMDKQPSYYWVNPLIDVDADVSSVAVHFCFSNITNSHYQLFDVIGLLKTAIIFCSNTSNMLTLNMSSSYFRNNSFYIDSNARGGICHFNGSDDSGVDDYLC